MPYFNRTYRMNYKNIWACINNLDSNTCHGYLLTFVTWGFLFYVWFFCIIGCGKFEFNTLNQKLTYAKGLYKLPHIPNKHTLRRVRVKAFRNTCMGDMSRINNKKMNRIMTRCAWLKGQYAHFQVQKTPFRFFSYDPSHGLGHEGQMCLASRRALTWARHALSSTFTPCLSCPQSFFF